MSLSSSSSSRKALSVTQICILQARNSFFECGLFPSRASISVMVWGVIWDKICKEEGKDGSQFTNAICHFWHFVWHAKVAYLLVLTTAAQSIRGNYWCGRNEGKKKKKVYPEGTQVLKQLVWSRNTQKYWADSLTAQTPGCKRGKEG